MPFPKTCVPFFLLPLLLGCSSPQATPEQIKRVEDTKAQMIGMSREEAFTCLGLPAKRTTEGEVEILSYTFGSCVADLTVGPDDEVKSVGYSLKPPDPKAKPPGEPPMLEEQCAKVPEVASCVRWLRK